MTYSGWMSWWKRGLSRGRGRRAIFRNPTPHIESLENRIVNDATLGPISGATSPTVLYLEGLYRDLLQRSPAPAEISGWAPAMASGTMTRGQAVPLFLQSQEYGGLLIRQEYQALLGRLPEPSGQASWLQFLETGGDHEQLTAALAASDEYYGRHGNTPAGWLSGVFQDLLGRAPDAAGSAYWTGALQKGGSRAALSMIIENSTEAHARQVAAAYQHYLQRLPVTTELNWWVSMMDQGLHEATVIAQFASSEEYYQAQQNQPEPLVYSPNLQYVGAFRVPAVFDPLSGDDTYSFGGTALAIDPASHGLFLVGMPYDQAVSEISIPTSIVNSTNLDALATATVLQPPVQVLSELPSNPLAALGTVNIGGLSVDGGRLLGTAYIDYDAGGSATVSHFTLDSLNLAAAKAEGLYQVGSQGAGLVAGYMTPIPSEWQGSLGATYLTGQADVNIISRTSSGPAVYGFDPSTLGASAAGSIPYVYYPVDNPLGPYVGPANPLQSGTSQVNGAVFVPGTRSVLFFGSSGKNYEGYGLASDYGDNANGSKSPHSLNGEYSYQVWAYDAADFVAARDGKVQPWQVKPYNVWNFDLPINTPSRQIGGTAFDPATGRFYVSILNADNEALYSNLPLIEVFQLNLNPPDASKLSRPQIGTLAATPAAPGVPGSTSPFAPGPIAVGTPVLLTAGNVYRQNSTANVGRVSFYLDTNGDHTLQIGFDKLLAQGTGNSSNNWTASIPTDQWSPGTYTLFAQAVDSAGLSSDPVSLSLVIT